MERKGSIGADVGISYLEVGGPGDGRTVLILHGWGFAASVYGGVARALARRGYRVVAIDLPGFGRSDSPPISWGYSEYADAVGSFIEKEIRSGDCLCVIGHSFGGGVALALAKEYPFLVDTLVVVDGTGIPIPGLLPALWGRKLVEMLLQLGGAERFGDWARMIRVFLANAIRHPLSMSRTMRLGFRGDLSDELPSIQVPVYVFWAARDMTVPVRNGRRLAELVRTTITFAPGRLFHDWCITRPSIFEHLLHDVLAGTEPREPKPPGASSNWEATTPPAVRGPSCASTDKGRASGRVWSACPIGRAGRV